MCSVLAGAAPGPVAGQHAALHVIPFPGTPDASPASQIIFSSLAPSQLDSVGVRGARSGLHAGRVTALPDRAGTAFVPDRSFTPGELVTVQAALSSPAAGGASGDPGATRLRFAFRVGMPGSPAPRPRAAPQPARVARGGVAMRFHSEPRLRPPAVRVTYDRDQRSGDMFLTPRTSRYTHLAFQPGLMILDAQGQLVWFRRVTGMPSNLDVQRYRGRPVLTWFQRSGRRGEDVIMNRSYRIVKILHAGDGYARDLDLHEFQITPQGTAFVDIYVPVRADLSSVGGPSDGTAIDCVIQELDVRTGRVLWEWHMLRHVPLSASYQPRGSTPYAAFHLNSIQQLPNGNLLISARHTWAVYEISRRTGRVIWTLGGKDSSFRMGRGTRFSWQHDARLHPDGTLTLFDDAFNDHSQQERQSSGKELKLNMRARRATLVRRYVHSPPLLAGREGSLRILPNHDVFIGWGAEPDFSEYTPAGRLVWGGTLPLGAESYRAYRLPWTGQPLTRPSMALTPHPGGRLSVYASWNGATQVASWRVLGGSRSGPLHALASRPRTGFETAITVDRGPRYLAIQALDGVGHVLGTSKPEMR